MLFDKFKIKEVELKNRIVMPPMITLQANEGMATDFHLVHYGIRSDMGVGLIIVEATAVEPRGRIYKDDLGLWDDAFIPNLKRITNYLKKNKTISCVQLAHAGRKAYAEYDIVAPSAIAFDDDKPVPRELTISEIEEVITKFKEAAVRAKIAGFDAVEIHGAHGYLINQFLSPVTNKRSDAYGNDRTKLLFEVIETVKEVFDGLIFVRLSADEYLADGNTSEFFIELAKKLNNEIDLIDISSGGIANANINLYPGYQVRLSKMIKDVVDIPVTAVGLINTYDLAENILQKGEADLIQFGRELLRNPALPYTYSVKYDEPLEIIYPYNTERVK